MQLQLIYEEKPGFRSNDNDVYDVPSRTEKPKIARKNRFSKRLHERAEEIKPRQIIPVHESESKLCMAIWQSVIIQAMYDLSGKGGNIERKMMRAEARAWFSQDLNGESDFEIVCDMANLDPSQVRKTAKTIRESDQELTGRFNFKTVRKRYSNRVGKRNKSKNI